MTCWGFPAASLPQMEQPNSTIHFTSSQSSWFATVPLLMSIPASMVGASACEWVGPRRLLLILSLPLCISSMAMSLASLEILQEAETAEVFLLVNRVIQGSLAALLMTGPYIYTYEICEHHLRASMTNLMNTWCTMGFLLSYIAGCFLYWTTISWVLPLITLVPGILSLLASSEAPLWLARRGQEDTARDILKNYRSTLQEVQEDLKVGLHDSKNEISNLEYLRIITKKSNVLAIVTSSVITTVMEFSGFVVLQIYLVHIFKAAGVGLDPRYSSVIVGCARLVCSLVSSYLIHNFKRRTLLLVGNLLAGVAAFGLGLFFYLQSIGYNVSFLSWLPLVGIVTYMFACSSAIIPSSWTMSVEVLPGAVRSFGFGMAMTLYSCVAFGLSKSFLYIESSIGMYGVFWLFASGLFLYALITLFLPETYQKSLQDIEDYWSKHNNNEHVKV